MDEQTYTRVAGFAESVATWVQGRGSILNIAHALSLPYQDVKQWLVMVGYSDYDGQPEREWCGVPVTVELVVSSLALYFASRAMARRGPGGSVPGGV